MADIAWRQLDDNHFLFMFIQLNGFNECRRNDIVDGVSIVIAQIGLE